MEKTSYCSLASASSHLHTAVMAIDWTMLLVPRRSTLIGLVKVKRRAWSLYIDSVSAVLVVDYMWRDEEDVLGYSLSRSPR